LGRKALKITADTNLLLRAILRDDARQTQIATSALREAELVAVPTSTLCEFVWVLNSGFKKPKIQIAAAIERLMSSPNIVMNRSVVEAGLALLRVGGDFADGVVAYEGIWLGAEEFVSFDVKAVALLQSQGVRSRLLS
jgi:predicted nucleic-acid-binding protein